MLITFATSSVPVTIASREFGQHKIRRFLDAPGVNMIVADTRGRSRPQSGTSLAVPFVTAAAAVVMHAKQSVGDLLLAALKASVSDLGRPGRDREFGWGLIRLPAKCQ
jgi:hypothetical protein